jgi:large-conductance mechanosensitive channel
MEAIVFLIILAVVWLLVKVSEAGKEAKQARDEVKGLLGRIREQQRELIEIRQALVPPRGGGENGCGRASRGI